MNITELDSYNLADAVKFHNRLNPKIWGKDEHLLPDVRQKLLEIAADFQEFLGIDDLAVEDITVSGSNAAYSYTPHSDIDLHLVVRMPEDADEVYQELFNAKKYQYNDLMDIKIHGADVELYVQPADEAPVSLGEYSIKNDDWIQVPRKKRAKIDHSVVRHKYEDLKARIESALKENDSDRVQALIDKIKEMRRAGLDAHGEFGAENLAFKMLRSQGYIKKLYDHRAAVRARELSLKEQNKPKQKFRYGFGEGHQGQPYSSEDGVSPTTCMFLNEDDTAEGVVQEFIQATAERLGIENMPTIELHSDDDWSVKHQSFGMYVPETHTLHVNLNDRHILDILRTTAHELAHCRQNELSKLPADAGKTGSDWENEAHAVAGIIMRDYADANPERFKDRPVNENASGYIPKNKKEARDPRYSMALTVDIKPGQVGKEANKLGLQTDKQGKPALLMKTANTLAESRDALFSWLKQQFPTWPDYVLKDFLYQQAKGIRNQAELEDFLKRNKQDFGQVKWRLEKLPITMDIFTPKTQRMIQSREGGSSNPFSVPRDAERHAQQLKMIQQQGVRTEPIIVAKLDNGYDLIEGWHRTIQHLKAYPQGYTGPAWVGYGATYQSTAEDKDPLAESLAQEFALFEEQDLMEIKMTSKNLSKLAGEIPGVTVGLEFEMIVPNVDADDDSRDLEPDYDQDESVNDIDDAVNFFDDGDYNSRGDLRRLRDDMLESFDEWRIEKVDEAWHSNGFEFFCEYLDREDPFDEEEHLEQAVDMAMSENPNLESGTDEYDDAVREKLNELQSTYYTDQWEDQGRNYDYAREEFEQDHDSDWDQGEWLNDIGVRTMQDVETHFGHVTWPHWTSYSDEDETDTKEVALNFMNAMGMNSVAVGSYHGYNGGYEKWDGDKWVKIGSDKPLDCFTIEPDGSLEGNSSRDTGLEFVSPPIPLEDIGTVMKKVQAWAADNGVYTGKQNATSLHTNISIPGYDLDKLDYLKAAILLGDEHVLRQFDRIGNTYAKPAINKVKDLVRAKPEKAKELLDKMKSHLDAAASKLIHSGATDKYTSINTKDNRIEYRSPGGDYLSTIADDPQKMIDTINRMVVNIDAAMDPNKYKEEYQKKLYKILTGQEGGREAKTGAKKDAPKDTNDLLNIFSRYAAGELPKAALKSFVRQAQLERKGKKAEAELASHNWAIRRRATGDIVRTFKADDYMAAHEVLKQYKRDHNITDDSLTYGPYDPSNDKPAQAGGRMYKILDTRGGLIAGDEYGSDQEALQRAAYWAQRRNLDVVVKNDQGQEIGRVSSSGEITPTAQTQSTQQSSGLTLNGRPSNPDGNYVIANRNSMTIPVYRFMAADTSDATEVLNQWRAEHPNEQWVINPDSNRQFGQPGDSQPISGSTLDLQRQRAAAQQSQQGNWGIWMIGADRFANQPGEYPRGAEVPLYRFPSREAAEQWIEQQRTTRPRMRTDIEVREIEPTAQRPAGEPSSYELYRISDGRAVTAPAGNPIRFLATSPEDAESKIARYAADFNLGAPELFAVRSVLQVPPQYSTQFGAARGAPNWELVRDRDQVVVHRIVADNQDDAIGQASDFTRMQGLDPNQYTLQAAENNDAAQGGIIDVAGDNWSADFERRMQGGGNNPEWENPQPAPTFGGEFTGEWKVVDPNGNEIYRFSGVGNSQSDANNVAIRWLQRNPQHMQGGVEVVPVMG